MNLRKEIRKILLERFVQENKKLYYHGRKTARPYTGEYIFITDSFGYASGFSDGKVVYVFTIPFPDNKLFSIKNKKHLELLSKHVDPLMLSQMIEDSGIGSEMDWATLEYFSTEEYEAPEDLLISLGFYGIKLKEREGINSVYIFDEKKLNLVDKIDITKPENIKKIAKFYKDFERGKNFL